MERKQVTAETRCIARLLRPPPTGAGPLSTSSESENEVENRSGLDLHLDRRLVVWPTLSRRSREEGEGRGGERRGEESAPRLDARGKREYAHRLAHVDQPLLRRGDTLLLLQSLLDLLSLQPTPKAPISSRPSQSLVVPPPPPRTLHAPNQRYAILLPRPTLDSLHRAKQGEQEPETPRVAKRKDDEPSRWAQCRARSATGRRSGGGYGALGSGVRYLLAGESLHKEERQRVLSERWEGWRRWIAQGRALP